MKRFSKSLLALVFGGLPLFSPAQPSMPEAVNPDTSPEARALLKYMQSLSGKYILSGQHNFPNSGSRNSNYAADYIGQMPAVWSQDLGFSEDGDKDSYLARPAVMQEAIRQHQLGSIITLCWHAVPPTADEPITFQPLPGADPNALASVQGRLSDQQFQDLLTPGTDLHSRWLRQVDTVAYYLKQLQDAKVPVLWRPYHEMNGDWFWWGGRYQGKYTTAALYRQIFDRMVKHHKLNNLVWVWSVDRPSRPDRTFDKYYPGNEYLDILAIDIYGNDFNQSYYDGLMALSKGKPVTLAEVGNPPAPEILKKQPNWVFWVVWAGMARGTSQADYEKLTAHPKVLFMEDEAYANSIREYRSALGFEGLVVNKAADFSGEWVLSECESQLQNTGPNLPPYKLSVVQKENELFVKATTEVEWAEDQVSEETLVLDGSDTTSPAFNNGSRVQNASWSPARDTLTIYSRVFFKMGDRPAEIKSQDVWSLKKRGKQLVIWQKVNGMNGAREMTLVYNKQR